MISIAKLSRDIRLLIFLALIFTYATRAAWAHGGGTPRLVNAQAGPYRVSVWTQPDPLRVDEAHFTVAVTEAPALDAATEAGGAPVLDAMVELQIKPISGSGKQLVLLATHEAAVNKLFYEADVELPAEGQWQVVISVEGPAGSGQADFVAEVLPSTTYNWWILVGGSVLGFIAAGWVVLKFGTNPKKDNL